MTDQQHPITPPPKLVQGWRAAASNVLATLGTETEPRRDYIDYIATRAAQWGADQELEACHCEVSFWGGKGMADRLRATRRPKPPSLKEQALEALGRMDQFLTTEDKVTILRALEQLDD